MPYIKPEERIKFDNTLNELVQIKTKGELEYCVFKLMKQYMDIHEETYSNLHDCTYAAIHCGDEFRRRFLDKREDYAMETNGDII